MTHRSRALPTRALRPASLLATAALVCGIAGMAEAQTAPGPRYVSWAGRPANTTPASVSAAPAHSGMIPRRVAPGQTISRPMMQPTPVPRPVSNGLTPASAWLGPQPVSSFAPGSPDPLAYTREMAAPVPAPAPVMANRPTVQPPPRQPGPDFLPDQGAPTTTVAEGPQPAPGAAADPMAPRADAPIFRLRPQAAPQQPGAGADQPAPRVYAEATAPVAAQPGQQGSRYYSVHREAGHAPDRTALPEAVFYDSVALDLAQPPETQVPRRDAQGRLLAPSRSDDPERP
jgi:Meckel syndrome type 1 protein